MGAALPQAQGSQMSLRIGSLKGNGRAATADIDGDQERHKACPKQPSPFGLPRGFSGKESACQCTKHRVQSLGREDPLEKGMATHSSILAWTIPWTEEPGGLQSWGRTELDTTERLTLSLSASISSSSVSRSQMQTTGWLALLFDLQFVLWSQKHLRLFGETSASTQPFLV